MDDSNNDFIELHTNVPVNIIKFILLLVVFFAVIKFSHDYKFDNFMSDGLIVFLCICTCWFYKVNFSNTIELKNSYSWKVNVAINVFGFKFIHIENLITKEVKNTKTKSQEYHYFYDEISNIYIKMENNSKPKMKII